MIEYKSVIIRDGIQFVIAQLSPQQLLRQRQRVVLLLVEHITIFLAVITDETIVELYVVPHEETAVAEFIKIGQNLVDGRRSDEIFVADSRQIDYFGGKPIGTRHKRGKLFRDVSVDELHRADFDDRSIFPWRADCSGRGFEVENDEGIIFEVVGLFQTVEKSRLRIIDVRLGKYGAVNGGDGLSLAGSGTKFSGAVP